MGNPGTVFFCPAYIMQQSAQIQKFLEEKGFEDIGGEFTYVPNDLKDLSGEERATIDKMVERLEDFDDVQNVYTNMKPAEEEAE